MEKRVELPKNYNIDFVKFMLSIIVVIIHVQSYYGSVESISTSLIVESIYYMTKFTVPLYFVLAGYLFLSSKNRYKLIKQNATNFVFIGIVYYIVGSVINIIFGMHFMHTYAVPLWFLQSLIIIQIFMYKFYSKRSISIALLIGIMVVIFRELNMWTDVNPFGDPKNAFTFLPFFCVGMLMRFINIKVDKKVFINTLVLTLIFMLLNIFLFHYTYSLFLIIPSMTMLVCVMSCPYQSTGKYYISYNINIFFYHYIIIDIIDQIRRVYFPQDDNAMNIFYLTAFIVIILMLLTRVVGALDYHTFDKKIGKKYFNQKKA